MDIAKIVELGVRDVFSNTVLDKITTVFSKEEICFLGRTQVGYAITTVKEWHSRQAVFLEILLDRLGLVVAETGLRVLEHNVPLACSLIYNHVVGDDLNVGSSIDPHKLAQQGVDDGLHA